MRAIGHIKKRLPRLFTQGIAGSHGGLSRQAHLICRRLERGRHSAKADFGKPLHDERHTRLQVRHQARKGLAHLVDDAQHSIEPGTHHAVGELHDVARIGGVSANLREGLARAVGKAAQVFRHLVEVNRGKELAHPLDARLEGCCNGIPKLLHSAIRHGATQRGRELVNAVFQHRQHGRAQGILYQLPRGTQPAKCAVQVVPHDLSGGCGTALGVLELSGQVTQRAHALVDQRTQGGPRLGAHRQDGLAASRASGSEFMQSLFKVVGGDTCGGQFVAELAGGVCKLAQDGVEGGTSPAGVNARIGKLADDGHGGLKAQAQAVGHGGRIAQRLGQAFNAGVGGVGTLCQHIGHTPGIGERQAHAHDGLGDVLAGRGQFNVTRLGQGQHGGQGGDGVFAVQPRFGQVFQSACRFGAGELGGGAGVFSRSAQGRHFFGTGAGGSLHAAEGRLQICRALDHAHKGVDAEVSGNGRTHCNHLGLQAVEHCRGVVLGIDQNFNGFECHDAWAFGGLLAGFWQCSGFDWRRLHSGSRSRTAPGRCGLAAVRRLRGGRRSRWLRRWRA